MLLDIRNLHVGFMLRAGHARAVDGISFGVDAGQTLGLVGESGCGKSMTALAIMRLVPPPGRITDGEIVFDGTNLRALSEADMRERRGRDIAMVFQEPMTSLNPVLTAGAQIGEAIRAHQALNSAAVQQRVVELLRQVEIPDPQANARAYPHQLSGGMRQRVMIAMALSGPPRLLIADEPTTALDVTIQAQILDLLAGLRDRLGMALLLVTHDLGIVAERADRLAVMYAGRLVEVGSVAQVFAAPRHPYTRGLLRSIPSLGAGKRRLEAIAGTIPNLLALPSGCRFRDRCPIAIADCATIDPVLTEVQTGHAAACIRACEPVMQH